MTTTVLSAASAIAETTSQRPMARVYIGRAHVMLERALMAFKTSSWLVVLSGFVEPVFYLAAFGYGLGHFVGNVHDGSGKPLAYAMFIAPALLASSAMNGAIYDSTWNVFFKMHFARTYQAIMATSMGPLDVALGEIGACLCRGLAYAIGFMVVMFPLGLIGSAWGLLAIPAAVLIAFGFSACGMAATSYCKSFQQLDWVSFAMLPMFLFSGTLFPLSVYPTAVRIIVEALPLPHAIALTRGLCLGNLSWGLLGHAMYFVVMTVGGLYLTTRRLNALFLS